MRKRYYFYQLHYILNWERAAPSPPLLGRAGSRGLADACWADSYTVWSPAQPATPQLHSSSSTPCLHTLAWEGGRKSQACQVSARQDSIIQPKPLPLPDVEVCNDSATKNQPVIAGMPVSLTAANQNQSLLGCQCLPAALTLITHFNHRGLNYHYQDRSLKARSDP